MRKGQDEVSGQGPILSVVVPVYQEEDNIRPFLERLVPVLEGITPRYEIIFVMDPGGDRTAEIIQQAIRENPRIRLMVMTRRWGQPACTIAGIEACTGQACVVIDVDLQDPPELIREMYRKWREEGYQVVYAQRRSRKGETLPKRMVSWLGYRLIERISEVDIPRNTGDFRLMDRKVVDHLRELKETHGFLRGLVAYVGYRQTAVLYDRDARHGGRSKYSQLTGSLKIGLNGVVAFSTKPLALATALGFLTAGGSAVLSLVYVGQKLISGEPVGTGISPIILLVSFVGGVQLICLGIVGEYIGRIYEEVRQRPKYLVARKVNFPGRQ
ncbi:MAG TPA: glycosyltransferase [Kiritimatiellae bacterium]|nr:glycosyltransferase [Kiritimatiellia bacterium]